VTDVEWRVAEHIGPHGHIRERHAYRDLTGHIAEALCEQTAFTEQLQPDDEGARLCPLCALFVGTALAKTHNDDDLWR
jgi:hypothetical protein